MSFIYIVLIGIVVSMDAFAVALCRGLNMRKINYTHTLVIALFFGGFQALMPLIGWFLSNRFLEYIEQFDHWVAFGLLAFLGVKMVIDSLHAEEDGNECKSCCSLNIGELFLMAIATSIDALAVGVVLACDDINILPAVSLIGAITFAICFVGVIIGNNFGAKYKNKAQLCGGIVLCIIGVRFLVDGLM
ncbi:MAG: manganese efflux pump [Clostridia bacterium]|nr:manganese efflux pump [Clostridia bacterium]